MWDLAVRHDANVDDVPVFSMRYIYIARIYDYTDRIRATISALLKMVGIKLPMKITEAKVSTLQLGIPAPGAFRLIRYQSRQSACT